METPCLSVHLTSPHTHEPKNPRGRHQPGSLQPTNPPQPTPSHPIRLASILTYLHLLLPSIQRLVSIWLWLLDTKWRYISHDDEVQRTPLFIYQCLCLCSCLCMPVFLSVASPLPLRRLTVCSLEAHSTLQCDSVLFSSLSF